MISFSFFTSFTAWWIGSSERVEKEDGGIYGINWNPKTIKKKKKKKGK